MSEKSFRFTHAVTRAPCPAIIDGLRAVDTGTPDLAIFLADHAAYIAALKSTGAAVIELPALGAYPDSVFVEDAALCLQEVAILMRPGAPSRLGEAHEMGRVLHKIYGEVLEIDGPGHIEGGDILTTEREILVGTSARTDAAGVAELRGIVSNWGYSLRVVVTPPDVLHFKTDCSILAGDTILSTPRLAASDCFEGYKVIHTADGEDACANAIRFNDLVLFPSGFPKTAALLDAAGFNVFEIGNTEAAKIDGGMSCLSLRFTPTP
jgi:dimethylargininase